MRYVRGFGSFWYQLIIGDDWRIAVAVSIALAAGALSAALDIVTGETLAVLVGLLVAVGFIANLIRSARSS